MDVSNAECFSVFNVYVLSNIFTGQATGVYGITHCVSRHNNDIAVTIYRVYIDTCRLQAGDYLEIFVVLKF